MFPGPLQVGRPSLPVFALRSHRGSRPRLLFGSRHLALQVPAVLVQDHSFEKVDGAIELHIVGGFNFGAPMMKAGLTACRRPATISDALALPLFTRISIGIPLSVS